MDTPMSVLRVLPGTTEEIARFSKRIIQSVTDGEANALEVLVMLKAFAKASEAILDSIESNIDKAAEKYSEKSFDVFGARVEKSEVGVSYDYSHSLDRDWEQFQVAEKTAANSRKEREAFLRALKEPLIVVDPDSGEVTTIKPPIKKSKTGLRVFLKK